MSKSGVAVLDIGEPSPNMQRVFLLYLCVSNDVTYVLFAIQFGTHDRVFALQPFLEGGESSHYDAIARSLLMN